MTPMQKEISYYKEKLVSIHDRLENENNQAPADRLRTAIVSINRAIDEISDNIEIELGTVP